MSSFVLYIRNNSTVSTSAAIRAYSPFGGVPLDLRAKAGAAPMRVNSSVRVVGLNSDYLDNYHANALARAARGDQGGSVITPVPSAYTPAASATLTAPAAGFVLVTGQSAFYGGSAGCQFNALLRDNSATPQIGLELFDTTPANAFSSLSPTYVFTVAGAGTRTYYIDIKGAGGTDCQQARAVISAEFIPFGSSGLPTTLGATARPAQKAAVPFGGTK